MAGNQILSEKWQHLQEILRGYGSVAVAFSSGVDSTLLLKAAHDVLGDKAIAVTAQSNWFPQRESEEAKAFCEKEGIHQLCVESHEDEIPGFCENPPDRCYLCKRALFAKLQEAAWENGIAQVAEGSNLDDLGDYRPGLRAIAELGIKSPLREAELTKQEIRELSRELRLPTWEKPSFACLASRFPYGERITEEKLRMVEQAEQQLLHMGFPQMRVRIHGQTARIELLQEDLERAVREDIRREIVAGFRKAGFAYVSLDLQGYRTGSMNETL